MALRVQGGTSALCPAFPEVIGGAGNVWNVQHHLVNPVLQQPHERVRTDLCSALLEARCDKFLT